MRALKLRAVAQLCSARNKTNKIQQQCSESHVPVRATFVGVAAVEGLQHSGHIRCQCRVVVHHALSWSIRVPIRFNMAAKHLSGGHIASTDQVRGSHWWR